MTSSIPSPIGGSFRDPGGRVFQLDGKIFRTVTAVSAPDYDYVRGTGLIRELIDKGKLVPEELVDQTQQILPVDDAEYILEHPRLDVISYPYEWSFPLLKSAAIHHLDILLDSLKHGVTLSDASAYNIQFIGVQPIFIDHLSFRKYKEGEYWAGHKQFCDQFLNPLLLRALLGVTHNAWYRGKLEGIPAEELSPLLKFRHKLKLGVFTNVVLQAKFQSNSGKKNKTINTEKRPLSRQAFEFILKGLKKQISGLSQKNTGETVWEEYANENSYDNEEAMLKREFIAEFSNSIKPGIAWDLGCNTGEYSQVLLENGTASVVGFDFDQGALEKAHARATARNLTFLPLFFDAANPSPDQGWAQNERDGLSSRANADAMIALAFIHHLAIARNIPLYDLIKWLVKIAPTGVIEFVPKSDPMVKELLRLREDIFPDYNESNFQKSIESFAKIIKKKIVSKSGRTLYWYSCS
jgi:ribosomal protein L11 methylase PrmA